MALHQDNKLCTAKQTINKTKINLWNRRRHLQMILQTKGWYPRSIKNFSNSTPKKWAEDMNRHFSNEDIQMANRHMKKRSKSLAIREIQVKTTLRYQKVGTRHKEILLQKRHTNGQQTQEKMLHITCHRGNTNLNYNEIPPHTS